MKYAEFSFKAGSRLRFSCELKHNLPDFEINSFDHVRRQRIFTAQLHAAIDCAVYDQSTGKRFIHVAHQLERFSPWGNDRGGVKFCGQYMSKAPGRLDGMLRTGKTIGRKECRMQPVLGSTTRMEAFAH